LVTLFSSSTVSYELDTLQITVAGWQYVFLF